MYIYFQTDLLEMYSKQAYWVCSLNGRTIRGRSSQYCCGPAVPVSIQGQTVMSDYPQCKYDTVFHSELDVLGLFIHMIG